MYRSALRSLANRLAIMCLLTSACALRWSDALQYQPTDFERRVLVRKAALHRLRERCSQKHVSCVSGDIYEFGIFTGLAMKAINQFLDNNSISVRVVWGFDSFLGLPREDAKATNTTDSAYLRRVRKKDYRPGTYSTARALKSSSPYESMHKLDIAINDTRVRWIPGFFERSLTPQLSVEQGMQPAVYVDFDVDLYTSTLQALKWMLSSRLVVPGTLLFYDDWDAGGKGGQQRAHREATQEYSVVLRNLGEAGPSYRKAMFEVISIG